MEPQHWLWRVIMLAWGVVAGLASPVDHAGAGGQAVIRLLKQRRGRKDFFILNTDDIRQTITQTSQTLTLMIAVISLLGSSLTLVYSRTAIVLVVLCSTLIGIVFGYLPARNATNLDSAAALSREWRH